MMGKKRLFGELELLILQIFKNKDNLTVKDVLESLCADDKYTTIMTVMSRLVKKKLLVRQRVGNRYEYRMNKSERPPRSMFPDKLKQFFFGGRSGSMVSYLLESGDDITDVELDEMEKLIKELKESRRK